MSAEDFLKWYDDIKAFDVLIPGSETSIRNQIFDKWNEYVKILYDLIKYLNEKNEEEMDILGELFIDIKKRYIAIVNDTCSFICIQAVSLEFERSKSTPSYIKAEKLKLRITNYRDKAHSNYDELMNNYNKFLEEIHDLRIMMNAEDHKQKLDNIAKKNDQFITLKQGLIFAVVTVVLTNIGTLLIALLVG